LYQRFAGAGSCCGFKLSASAAQASVRHAVRRASDRDSFTDAHCNRRVRAQLPAVVRGRGWAMLRVAAVSFIQKFMQLRQAEQRAA
jgi:hypothetical protein